MAASTFEFIRLQICALIFSFVSESFAGDAFKIVESFRERKICLPFPITTKDHWNIVYLSLRANKKKTKTSNEWECYLCAGTTNIHTQHRKSWCKRIRMDVTRVWH